MAIRQITFDPTKWVSGSGAGTSAGSNGYDAYTVYMDRDGLTAWAFEASGAGFARFNLSDGSIIFQGACLNVPGNANVPAQNLHVLDGFATIVIAQDDQNHYYVLHQKVLYKAHVASSTITNLWNGYMTIDATLDLSSVVAESGELGWTAKISPASDGSRYLIISTLGPSKLQSVAVNVDTMALVGIYQPTTLGAATGMPFMDSAGNFWFWWNVSNGANSFTMTKWVPASGASGGNLVVVTSVVNQSQLTSDTTWLFAGYVAANNSALMGSNSHTTPHPSGHTGYLVSLSLTTFNRLAFHTDDGTLFFADGTNDLSTGTDLATSMFEYGIQSSGDFAIPGDVSPETTQQAGIINIIDPVALTLLTSFNITSLITAAALTPLPNTGGVVNMPSNMQFDGKHVVVAYNNSSPVYILDIVYPPAPPSLGPCVPVDGNGNLTGGTYVRDLSLFILPETALYTNPILPGAITTSELGNEGRKSIVLDFNNGDGLYARDLGCVLEWPTSAGIQVFVWQPSIIPMPEGIFDRASDWDDGGNPGAKFIQGVIVEAFSFGQSKTFFLQDSDTLTLHALNECPIAFAKQQEIAFSCVPFVAHSTRVISTDGVEWRVWKATIVSQPFPESTLNWQTELTSLGMTGWAHAREMNLAYLSTASVTLKLTFDSIAPIVLTLPSTSGVQAKTKITLPPNKWKLIGFQASSTSPFRVFQGDIQVKLREWGAQGPYGVVKPFGGKSSAGAAV